MLSMQILGVRSQGVPGTTHLPHWIAHPRTVLNFLARGYLTLLNDVGSYNVLIETLAHNLYRPSLLNRVLVHHPSLVAVSDVCMCLHSTYQSSGICTIQHIVQRSAAKGGKTFRKSRDQSHSFDFLNCASESG